MFGVDTRGDSRVSVGESGASGVDWDIGIFWNRGRAPGVPLEFQVETCWEPDRGVPPVANVMRLRGPTGKCDPCLKGASLNLLLHLPQIQSLLPYCIVLFTYFSGINWGLSHHHLFLEKVNLELLDNKSPGTLCIRKDVQKESLVLIRIRAANPA